MKRSYEMVTDGFKGKLMLSQKSAHKTGLIVLGGAESIPAYSQAVANRFKDEGVDALMVSYTAGPHGRVNGHVSEIPLEYVVRAAKALYNQGYEKVGVWGVSMGAVVALTAASYYPDLFKFVVAVSPMHVVTQAISWRFLPHCLNTSAISNNGRPLPYVGLGDHITARLIIKTLKEGELWTRQLYTYGLKHPFTANAYIPVERIKGPILLISAKKDVQVPSEYSCKKIKERLAKNNFAYPVRHLSYYHADHMLVPPDVSKFESTVYGLLYGMDRRYPIACRKNRRDAFKRTIEFINNLETENA